MEIKGVASFSEGVAEVDLRRHIAAAIDDHQSRGVRCPLACVFASTGFAGILSAGATVRGYGSSEAK